MTASFIVECPGAPAFEVRLEGEQVTVGRADTNDVSLRDMNVSRHHFTVEVRPGVGCVLRDANSRNGTVVNGVSVIDKVLGEGDRVQVGASVLTFRAAAGPGALAPAEAPRATEAAQTPVAGVPLRPSDSGTGRSGATPPPPPFPTPPDAARGTTPPARPRPGSGRILANVAATQRLDEPGRGRARPALDLPARGSDMGTIPRAPDAPIGRERDRWRKLAEVACAINLEHDIDRLLETIVDAVLSLVPSKSGFLVLRDGEELSIRARRNAPDADLDADTGAARLSRHVCLEAIAQERPVLTQDAVGDQRFGEFLSVARMRLRSILCVPFASQEGVLGVVYLDEPEVDPFAEDGEVVELVAAFGDLAGIALANARLLAEIATRERLEEELRIAGRIQQGFLPRTAPTVRGLQVAGRTIPARSVGGDIYDFIWRDAPARELLVSIGDVAGKGVGAGLVMGTVRSLLRVYAELHLTTDEVLVGMNRHLARDLDAGLFVSFLLLRYSEETGQLAFTGAGHEHLILYRPSTGQLELMRAGGVVLGLTPDIRGRVQERSMTLRPGDVVCLYTDGATEARDPAGAEFGLEGVSQAVREGPTEPEAVVERVTAAVRAFSGGAGRELHDDLTVVALRRT